MRGGKIFSHGDVRCQCAAFFLTACSQAIIPAACADAFRVFGVRSMRNHVGNARHTCGGRMAVAWQMWQTCGRRVADVVKTVADVAVQEREYLGYFFSIDSTSATLFTTSATRLPHVCHVCHAAAMRLPQVCRAFPIWFLALSWLMRRTRKSWMRMLL